MYILDYLSPGYPLKTLKRFFFLTPLLLIGIASPSVSIGSR
jgi:hypothetical protein